VAREEKPETVEEAVSGTLPSEFVVPKPGADEEPVGGWIVYQDDSEPVQTVILAQAERPWIRIPRRDYKG
jgi:hypothetical protein